MRITNKLIANSTNKQASLTNVCAFYDKNNPVNESTRFKDVKSTSIEHIVTNHPTNQQYTLACLIDDMFRTEISKDLSIRNAQFKYFDDKFKYTILKLLNSHAT